MMRSRSGMAVLVLGLAPVFATSPVSRADDVEAEAVENKVRLVLQISGLGPEGALIEIRPGHKACDFKPVNEEIKRGQLPPDSVIKLDLDIEAETTSADRDCSFAITVKEPGQTPKTYHRGLRLTDHEAGQPLPSKILRCYLSSPSIATRDTSVPRRR